MYVILAISEIARTCSNISVFAFFFENLFELKRNIEMIFNRAFVASRDNENRLDAAIDGFFDGILNQAVYQPEAAFPLAKL